MGELPLLRRAAVLRLARRGGPPRAARARRRRAASRTCRRGRRCACPPRSSRWRSCTPSGSTRGWATSTPRRSPESDAVIVNIDYPLGVAAYNILREVAVDSAALRGVYVLGKAATLNADVGDVMISSVVHDEHSGSTYWLDNAFGVDDLSRRPALRHRARQPARGHRQEHLPAEPRLPRLLLPRGVHGRGDGGRPLLQRHLRDRRRRPAPGRRGRQLLEAADRLRDHPLRLDTPYTQARTLARAASATTGWTRPTPRRWRSCAGSCASRARSIEGSPSQSHGRANSRHVASPSARNPRPSAPYSAPARSWQGPWR